MPEFARADDVLASHLFYRREGRGRYEPLTSLDGGRAQEQFALDCRDSTGAYLTFDLTVEGEGGEWDEVVRYDLRNDEVVRRWGRDELEPPEVYEGIGYVSEVLQLCDRGRTLRCTAALFGAPAVDDAEAAEASYDFWVCELDLETGRLERTTEMESPFC
jgi:hypothetical protein